MSTQIFSDIENKLAKRIAETTELNMIEKCIKATNNSENYFDWAYNQAARKAWLEKKTAGLPF